MADQPPSERREPGHPGDHIGHYKILEELGRGGMGMVFRARDTLLDREVALKSPWADLAAEPLYRNRFLREIKLESRLSHPNIVPLYEAFEADGVPWLVMQLIPGESLRAHLDARGKLQMKEVLRFAEHVASALEAAHREGILHRDINPKNIIVSEDGRALVTDFGLARLLRTDLPVGSQDATDSTDPTSLTSHGTVVGTPHYMSPEQILGRPLDERSDIFSFGGVLYEMVTGERPFGGQDRGELINAIVQREPEPIPRFTYEAPAELERIVRKCLAKQPEERYQRAEDLLVDLRTLRREEAFRDYSESHSQEQNPAPPRTSPLRAWLIPGLVSVAAVALFVVLWIGRHRNEPVFGEPKRLTSAPGWEGEPALSPDGTEIAYASLVGGNSDIYLIGVRGGSPLRLTSDPAPESDPCWLPDGSAVVFTAEHSDGLGIWRVPKLGGDPILLIPDGFAAAVAPNGDRIAFARVSPEGRDQVCVASLREPNEVTVLTESAGGWGRVDPTWSPDGTRICYVGGDNLWVIPVAGGSPKPLLAEPNYHVNPVWSARDDRIYFSSMIGATASTLALWSVPADGGTPTRLTLGTGPETHPSLSRDGTRLAYSTESSRFEVARLDLHAGTVSIVDELSGGWMPALSRDGTRAVVVSDRAGEHANLWLLEWSGGRPTGPARQITDDPVGNAAHPALSPDGSWVAYYRIIGNERDLWAVRCSGGQPTRLTDDPGTEYQPAWSPDGGSVAFSSDRDGGFDIWVLPVAGGKPAGSPRRLTQGLSAVGPAWSPDGKQIAFIGMDGTFDVWVAPVDGSRPPRRLTDRQGPVTVRWPFPDRLVVSAYWGSTRIGLRSVRVADGAVSLLPTAPECGRTPDFGPFDVAPAGDIVLFCRETLQGDIWVLSSHPASR